MVLRSGDIVLNPNEDVVGVIDIPFLDFLFISLNPNPTSGTGEDDLRLFPSNDEDDDLGD